MKKLLIAFALIFASFTLSFAQRGTTEVSTFVGGKSYTQLHENPGSPWATYWGGGVQLKHHVTDIVYLVADFNGGWDGYNSTHDLIHLDGSKSVLSKGRQEFNLMVGVGATYFNTHGWSGYIHAGVGAGTIDSYDSVLEGIGTMTYDTSKTSMAMSASTGIDYHIGRGWKVGLFYTNTVVQLTDMQHLYGLKVSFALPRY